MPGLIRDIVWQSMKFSALAVYSRRLQHLGSIHMFRSFFAISAGLLTAVLALPVHADTILDTGTDYRLYYYDWFDRVGNSKCHW
jgi:hypothetical protein